MTQYRLLPGLAGQRLTRTVVRIVGRSGAGFCALTALMFWELRVHANEKIYEIWVGVLLVALLWRRCLFA